MGSISTFIKNKYTVPPLASRRFQQGEGLIGAFSVISRNLRQPSFQALLAGLCCWVASPWAAPAPSRVIGQYQEITHTPWPGPGQRRLSDARHDKYFLPPHLTISSSSGREHENTASLLNSALSSQQPSPPWSAVSRPCQWAFGQFFFFLRSADPNKSFHLWIHRLKFNCHAKIFKLQQFQSSKCPE